MRHLGLVIGLWALGFGFSTQASAQTPAIAQIAVEQEGIPLTEPVVLGLLKTRVGTPLDMRDVRESITHLMSLNRYEDVQVYQDALPNGIRLRYVLMPLHPIDQVEYRGTLALPEDDLRQAVVSRYGNALVPAPASELQRLFEQFYRDRGYVQAKIATRVEPTHMPDRASLIFDITAGPRSSVATIDVESVPVEERGALLAETNLRVGQPYDSVAIQRALDRYQAMLRGRGFYEARAVHFVSFDPAGGARINLSLERGPLVSVMFTGDPIEEDERAKLVPIRSEASVDEDLLEDSSRAIEEYLKTRGYRDALATYTRDERPDQLVITFAVSRGARYLTDDIKLSGNMNMSSAEILQALQVKTNAPFVQDTLIAGVNAVRNIYRSRGFTRADIRPNLSVLPGSDSAGSDRHAELLVTINEGPRTRIGIVSIQGAMVFTEAELRGMMTAQPGRPFNEVEVATDRDRIDIEYRNRGYDSVVIDPRVVMDETNTRADVNFMITEGPQVFVDQVIILGNRRTRVETISRELTLKSGQPLGYSALLESQQRLGALGLFRRIQITPLAHPGEPRRDILVQVEEAPPTTIDYGGGIEGGFRLRPTGDNGQAEDRFEFAPRGFFGIGRRNLFGRNRAVNLFTRVSLRSRDIILGDNGVRLVTPAAGSGYGFNEYRVLGTYREPRIFNTGLDVLVTGILDQAIRSSFNFRTREVRAEVGSRLSNRYSMAARYSFEHTKLFDERFTEAEKPLIDRLFPRVRLSKVSSSLIRDTRDDVLYPKRGMFSVIDGEAAARKIGSEVGFIKTFLQSFAYVPLPTQRRVVLALGARLGAAHGFKLNDAQNEPFVLLPASERFFAGGDTTVRGFSLDRLGDERTISTSGFPTGGNGELVFQSELRVSILREKAEVVGFVDAGNIYPRASDLNLTDLRPAAGFGGRYRSPVGPIRVDLGFNLNRKELVPGTLERGYVWHISLGQAF